MALVKVLLFCVGVCLYAKNGEAAPPTLTTATLTVAENTGTIGSAVASTTIASVSISSQTNTGQFTATVTGSDANIAIALAGGFTLSFETASTYSIVLLIVDATPETGTVTVTVSITDVADEYATTRVFACLSGTSYSAGATLATQTVISSASVTYSIASQDSDLLAYSNTGVISVATGKSLSSTLNPYYAITVRAVNSAPATSEASVVIALGCSSGGAVPVIGFVTLLMAALVALLQ